MQLRIQNQTNQLDAVGLFAKMTDEKYEFLKQKLILKNKELKKLELMKTL